MKKLNLSIRSIFVLCLAAVSVAANAQQVSQEEAANIALQFLKGNDSHNARLRKATPEALKLVYTEPSAKDKSANLYVYNMEGGGFAIVSGDARTGSQILGYSFDNNFSAKGMPDNVKYWLGEYSRQIDFIKAHQPEVSESKRREGLKMEDAPTPPENVAIKVAPMLKTTWGQSAPYYGMTPTLKNSQQEDQHTVTGCVATAMAQIMNYHQWPAQGKGKGNHSYYWWNKDQNSGNGGLVLLSADFSGHTYDWINMTDSYSDGSSLDEKNAVAQLMSDCGVAVDMDYGLEASGAYDDKVVTALTSYFGYSHNISLRHQSEFENNDAGWTKLLTDELDAKRPVYYAAEDDNDDDAHAFVLDGYGTYKSKTYFHINWGWDGYDGTSTTLDNNISNDGYFAMDSFNPIYRNETGNTDHFNQNSVAIVGIYPASDLDLAFGDLEEGWYNNWETTQETGTGVWKESRVVAYSAETPLSFTREQNKTYNSIYRITLIEWDKNGSLSQVDNQKTKNLIFYWNSETNECYLPTQYTNLKNGQNHEYYYVNNNIIGHYNPITEQFFIEYDVYELSRYTGGETVWRSDDPEGLLQALLATKYTNRFKYDGNDLSCPIDPSDETNYHITGEDKNGNHVNYVYYIQKSINNVSATFTLEHQEADHKGLYLGNFTEQNDGTATQVAGFISIEKYVGEDEEGEEYYWYEPIPDSQAKYRIGMMQVTEKTSKTDIIEFANSLKEKGDNASTYNVPCSLRTADKDDEPVEFSITEGAYYVVVAHYDDNEVFTSYEYMPVFFSKEENWETVADNCKYHETPVGGMYQSFGITDQFVTVQQYKGNDLIKNAGDKIFRIVNPYKECPTFNHEYLDDEQEPPASEHRENIRGETNTYRTNVYLYLYVDADNNVSLYPDYFELQPLGLDWGCGEMMLKQNQGKYGKFTTGIDGKSEIEFVTVDDLAFNEYYEKTYSYDLDDSEANWFRLQLPATLKNYLTLHDDEPYTLTDEDIEGLPKYNGIYYTRELDEDNDWGTLMLPFKFNTGDIDKDFTFYKLTSASTSQLTFTEISSEEDVAANTPIIFKREDGSTKNLEVSGVAETDGYVDLSSCDAAINQTYNDANLNDWTFRGVYNSGAIKAPNGSAELAKCYFFEGNEIWNVDECMNLYQYRGYFRYNGNPASLAKQIPVRFDDDEYTSLDALFNGEQPVKKYGKGRFNLQGQAVGKDYKGVVIEDGRKKISY